MVHEGPSPHTRRTFGGVGLMLKEPHWTVTAKPAEAWSADGAFSNRVLEFGQRFAAAMRFQQPFHLETAGFDRSHVGLGSGTQLALAVGTALSQAQKDPPHTPFEIASLFGRGRRSAIGIHGFVQGGFLVEAGKSESGTISPCVARMPFPEDWPILLLIPRGHQGEHGSRELDAFSSLRSNEITSHATDALARLALLHLLPGIAERNYMEFAEAIFEYNVRVGEMFRPWQGGIYSHAITAKLVDFVRSFNISAVGQSSWGPTVFVILPGPEMIEPLRQKIDHKFGEMDFLVCRANNHGAVMSRK